MRYKREKTMTGYPAQSNPITFNQVFLFQMSVISHKVTGSGVIYTWGDTLLCYVDTSTIVHC